MDVILQLDRVTKRFGELHAVKDISLNFGAGEFVTLLGPSGCGKSTTLRLIGGFEVPNEGRIIIQGQDSTRIPPNKRNVNMVFQDYALFPHLSVERNVGFGLQLKGYSTQTIKARVDHLLELVQLENLGKRAPHQLSGGQRQRVALARALAPDPPLLLLDEPLGALDANLRRDMQIELRSLQRATGKTFILVTHDQEEALTMSDTVVVMNRGEVEQVGSPIELYNNPKTGFVAKFIGEMNFFAGEVIQSDERWVHLSWSGGTIKAPRGMRDSSVKSRLTVAVRPEEIKLSRVSGSHANSFPATIKERFFRGAEVRYVIEVGGGRIDVVGRQYDLVEGSEEIWASWDAERTLVL